MIKGLLFDLDGVLINTEMWHFKMDEICLSELGYDDISPMAFISLIGAGKGMDPWENVYRQIPEKYRTNGFKEKFRDYKLSKFVYPPFKELLFPEAKEALQSLKEHGYLLACCSSSKPDYIEKALKDCDIYDYFDVVLSGHDFNKSKPDPEIYLTAMNKLGLDNPQCVVIEDSSYGIEAGKNAEMTVFCIKDYFFGIDQTRADYYLENLKELNELLSSISNDI